MELFERINKACAAANTIPHINEGGCCVFAHALGAQLAKEGQDVAWVALRHSPREPSVLDVARLIHNRNDVWEWFTNGISFFHVALQLQVGEDFYIIDSRGIKNVPQYTAAYGLVVSPGTFSIAQLRAFSAPNGGMWNSAFNRKLGVPRIKAAVKTAFS